MFYCSGFQSAVFMFYRTEEVIGVGVFLQRVFPYTVSLVGLTLGITDDVSTVPSRSKFHKEKLLYQTVLRHHNVKLNLVMKMLLKIILNSTSRFKNLFVM